ncbi:Protein of unknown function [Thermomonospora echinospora]|uniref:DUF2795 domain-containing protein n=1 Tax=Thermomonospora echinospora TaxID=1992 RepID=A0A1H6D4C0_9ACTN|nr:DUF2795 domain-containing protein [Thermomonospora echinospora]SEG80187.1 Protein of unknown function [Thermomonospora echinospora]
MKLRDPGKIKEALNDLDFPAAKEEIVRHARSRGARRDVDQALSALPPADYANIREVLRSVPLDPDPDLSESERAERHRQAKHKNRLSEHEIPIRPSPVEEELRRRR